MASADRVNTEVDPYLMRALSYGRLPVTLPALSAVRPSDDFRPGMPYPSSAVWSFRTLRCTVWPDTPATRSALT